MPKLKIANSSSQLLQLAVGTSFSWLWVYFCFISARVALISAYYSNALRNECLPFSALACWEWTGQEKLPPSRCWPEMLAPLMALHRSGTGTGKLYNDSFIHITQTRLISSHHLFMSLLLFQFQHYYHLHLNLMCSVIGICITEYCLHNFLVKYKSYLKCSLVMS